MHAYIHTHAYMHTYVCVSAEVGVFVKAPAVTVLNARPVKGSARADLWQLPRITLAPLPRAERKKPPSADTRITIVIRPYPYIQTEMLQAADAEFNSQHGQPAGGLGVGGRREREGMVVLFKCMGIQDIFEITFVDTLVSVYQVCVLRVCVVCVVCCVFCVFVCT